MVWPVVLFSVDLKQFNAQAHWITVTVMIPFVLAAVPFHRLINRPQLHLPWYRRPEHIVQLVSGAVACASYLTLHFELLGANQLADVPFFVASFTFLYSIRWVRLR